MSDLNISNHVKDLILDIVKNDNYPRTARDLGENFARKP